MNKNRFLKGIIILWLVGCSSITEGLGQVTVVEVEQGDTLWSIAEKYLGDRELWPILAEYNNLKNPHLIFPGDKIKIIESEKIKITSLCGTNKVKRAKTEEYIDLKVGDVLTRGDEVRLGTNSRLQLELKDGGRVQLKSKTSIVIKECFGVKTNLYLLLGTIFFKGKGGAKFEIRTPAVSCLVRGTEFQTEHTQDEVSKISVFAGQTLASAVDKEINIPAGFGSRIEKGTPPSLPIPLPEPPQLIQPEDDCVTSSYIVKFIWKPVDNHNCYRFELAKDELFNELIYEESQTITTTLTLPHLIPGKYYWRVSSINKLGLEGKFSPIRRFEIIRPMACSILPNMPVYERDGVIFASLSTQYTIQPQDKETNIDKIIVLIDKNNFEIYTKPITFKDSGTHTILYQGMDLYGNKGDINEIKVVVDTFPPEVRLEIKGVRAKKISEKSYFMPFCKEYTVNLLADDPSGIDKILYAIDRGEMFEYNKPLLLDGEKRHQIRCRVSDKFGNWQERVFILTPGKDCTNIIFFIGSLLGIWH